jgi:hypothetical protein
MSVGSSVFIIVRRIVYAYYMTNYFTGAGGILNAPDDVLPNWVFGTRLNLLITTCREAVEILMLLLMIPPHTLRPDSPLPS